MITHLPSDTPDTTRRNLVASRVGLARVTNSPTQGIIDL